MNQNGLTTHAYARYGYVLIFLASLFAGTCVADDSASRLLQPIDVFQLEYAADPQISADGSQIVYTRTFFDVMKDRKRSNLWLINADGSGHRPITSGNTNESAPRWSPDGKRLLYVSNEDGSNQLYVRWMDDGQTAKLTQLQRPPGGLSWSPDGRWVAFSMMVEESRKPYAPLSGKPKGAKWGEPAKVIDKVTYRQDGGGYVENGHTQIFVVPAEGGTPRQVSSGPYDQGGAVAWSRDGRSLYFSANRNEDRDYDLLNSEIYRVDIATGDVAALTDRPGPDANPAVSPGGKRIAYLGFDDQFMGYQITRLYVMDIDGGNSRVLTAELDRDVTQPKWSADGKGLYFRYDDQGNTKIAYVSLDGRLRDLADNVGGTTLGRPYPSGSYSVADNGRFVFTQTRPEYPADLAVGRRGSQARRITRLNEDLFAFKDIAPVEEFHYRSSFDGRDIEGWIAKPPGFDPDKKYPLILEIHGGPFANYGDRFSPEVQLYAAAGYVVLYTNPRGSTSYGAEFGNLIHHAYPGNDHDDLMSGVDALIEQGYIDTDRLYITGGSGGGVLTAWAIGKTDRFRAAVVAKPVINWHSFVLTSDFYPFFTRYWFPGPPWEIPEHYHQRSPLSLVGNVSTPTMLLTGEADFRTPISESEQYYQALKLRKIETVLVRVPDAPHGIAASRPSALMAKVTHILKWFDDHGGNEQD